MRGQSKFKVLRDEHKFARKLCVGEVYFQTIGRAGAQIQGHDIHKPGVERVLKSVCLSSNICLDI